MAQHTEDYSNGPTDMTALEEQIRSVPVERPHARLISNRLSDSEMADNFKKRMLALLAEQSALLDEMKAAGPFTCNFQWGVDATGRHYVAAIQITRVYA